MRWMKVLFLSLACFTGAAAAGEWPTATPESQGMDAAALAALVDYGGNAGMDSLVVARNGKVVAEAYYAPYRASMLHRVNSATKAVVGMLAGIAITRGDLPPPETPIATLFPRLEQAGDARWKAVTLQHLLDMTSGIDWDESLNAPVPRTAIEMDHSRHWENFILDRPLARNPGALFDYNSGNPHLLAVALSRRTGTGVEAYAQQHLFGPLDIRSTRWRKDPQGVAIGGYGLYMHTRDMARLGQLYLQRGEWEGRQIVPRAWAERVFSPRVDMSIPGFRYADFWWSLPARGVYLMAGFNRQLVMVIPELHIVAAMTGRANWPFEDVIGHLRRAATASAELPPHEQAQARLRQAVESAAAGRPLPAGVAGSPAVAQGRYRLEDNAGGVRELVFDFEASPPRYTMVLRTRELIAPLGVDGRYAEVDDAGSALFTRSVWTAPATLRVDQRWPEEAASVDSVIRFDADGVEIRRTNQAGVVSVIRGRRVAAP